MLACLRAMGHGDELAIVDGNYPALAAARRLIRADGHPLIPVLDAVLTVLPLDTVVPDAVFRTGWMNDPGLDAPIHREIDLLVRDRTGFAVKPLAGEAFYDRVRHCHAVFASSEPALYANVILRKGVVAPPVPKDITQHA